MKKLVFGTLALLSLPFIIGCTPQTSYVVNEQEFNNALSMEDVQYLQLKETSSTQNITIEECSPTVYHTKSESPDSYYEEFVSREPNDVYYRYECFEKGKGFTKEIAASNEFKTPQTTDNNISRILINLGASSFSQYKFDGTNRYTAIVHNVGDYTTTIWLTFVNKKFNSLSYQTSVSPMVYEYVATYNNVTPTLPPV